MRLEELIRQIKERLSGLFGDRFKGLILYGSEARGETAPDSDIDLLALLDGPLRGGETFEIVDATYALQLEMPDRMIHIVPAPAEDYASGQYGFYREILREGVSV